MLYKKITPHLVARFRASPGPAEKRRRGESGGLNPHGLLGRDNPLAAGL